MIPHRNGQKSEKDLMIEVFEREKNKALLEKVLKVLESRKLPDGVTDTRFIGYHGASLQASEDMISSGIKYVPAMKMGTGQLGYGFYVGSRFSYANTYAHLIFNDNKPRVVGVGVANKLSSLKGVLVDHNLDEAEKSLLEKEYDFVIPKDEAELYLEGKGGLQICFTKKALDKGDLLYLDMNLSIDPDIGGNGTLIESKDKSDLVSDNFSTFFDQKVQQQYILNGNSLTEVNSRDPRITSISSKIGDSFKVYEDSDKKLWFVKDYYAMNSKNAPNTEVEDYVKNEILANKIYAACGVKVPDYRFLAMNGKLLVASEFIENASHKTGGDLNSMTNNQKSDIINGIGIDWLLAANDWVGTDNANLCFVGDEVVRIDYGSSLEYSASQLKKKEFTEKPQSFDDFVTHAESKFLKQINGYTREEARTLAYIFLSFADINSIKNLVNLIGPGDKKNRKRLSALIEKRVENSKTQLSNVPIILDREKESKLNKEREAFHKNEILKNYKYDDDDIIKKVSHHVKQKHGGFRVIKGRQSNFIQNKIDGHNVLILPPSDNSGSYSLIKPFLKKSVSQILYLSEADRFPFKILFGYNLSRHHWNTGEIVVTKNGNEISVIATSHDPYGRGRLSSSIEKDIQSVFAERFQSNVNFQFKESQFQQKRQNDGVSCGLIVAREMIERINGRGLTKVYDAYALNERREDVAERESNGEAFLRKQEDYRKFDDSGYSPHLLSKADSDVNQEEVFKFIHKLEEINSRNPIHNLKNLINALNDSESSNRIFLAKIKNELLELDELRDIIFENDGRVIPSIDTLKAIGLEARDLVNSKEAALVNSFQDEKGKIHSQRYSNDYYELWNDPDGLEYVRLKSQGLLEISNHYFERGNNIDIRIEERWLNSKEYSLREGQFPDQNDFLGSMRNLSETMENGEIKGLIYSVENRYGHVMHTMPFAVAKKNNGETEIVDFEGWFQDHMAINGINIRQVENYFEQKGKRAQLDHHSCTVFAIDTLKNCLSSKKFAQDVMTENGYITLDKMALGQSKEYREKLSESKKNSYIFHDDRSSKHNLKAFYKGHQYAEIINEDHKNLLQQNSRRLVDDIDENRRARKASEREWPGVDSEIKIEPSTSIKAVMIEPLMTNKKSFYYCGGERGNKFRAVAAVYENQKIVENTFIDILSKIADDKDLNKMQVMAIIEKSKERGSLKGDEALGNIIDGSGNIIVTGEQAKKFSAAFQKECKKSGIYTGREEGVKEYHVGLRLTFIPDSVVKDVGKMKIDDFGSRTLHNDLKNIQDSVKSVINSQLQR